MLGDPILTAGQNTFYITEDLDVTLPVGSLWFSRTFSSSQLTWTFTAQNYPNRLWKVPVPFGHYAATEDQNNPRMLWTHTYYSYVAHELPAEGQHDIRTIWGAGQTFFDCTTVGGQCAMGPMHASTRERLLKLDAGYIYIQNDGTRQYYGARYVSDAGSGGSNGRELFFLSKLVDAENRTIALVQYRSPDGGGLCPPGRPGSDPGVPYISRVLSPTTDAGLGFTWAVKTIPGSTATECVITQVDVLRPDGVGPSVPLTYRNNQSGWLQSAGGGLEPETYDYDGGFGRQVGGAYVAFNPAAVNGMDSTGSTLAEAFNVAGADAGDTCAPNTCCATFGGRRYFTRTVTYTNEGYGNGSGSDPGFTRTYTHHDIGTGSYLLFHGTPIHRRTDACTNADSCTPGDEYYGWLESNAPTSGACANASASAYRNERGNWFADRNVRHDPGTIPDAGPFAQGSTAMWERRGIERGIAPDITSNNALETWGQQFGYTSDLSAQFVNHVFRPSVVVGGADAGVAYKRVSPSPGVITGRIEAVYQYGYTKSLTGTPQFRVLGTFYKTQRTCEDFGAPDPLGRTVAIEGPCEVSAVGATACIDTTAFPRSELHYFATTTLNANAGRLNRAVQYPSGTCTGGLVTRYENYTPEGDPQEIHDANDAGTFYTYENRHIISRAVPLVGGGNKTWSYVWDNGKLKSIGYPQGNFDFFCYRAGSSCNGAWLRNLQWQAKSAAADGTGWNERISYEYWPNDSLKRAVYVQGNTKNIRREEWFDENAEGEPVRHQVGTGTGSFVDRRTFDGAGNLSAVGPAFNYPGGLPEFCASNDGRCAWLGYDRANRLGQLDVYPTGSAPGIRTCFDSDAHGNIRRVSQGCSTSSACELDGGLSTCAAANSWNDYQHDDFGNVVEATLANTDNGAGTARGVTRYAYDALGSLTEVRFPSGVSQSNTYDKLGRLLGTTSAPFEAFTLTYDDATVAPTNCGPLANTKGRLARRTDAVWTTYYSYDSEGRVVRESRGVGTADCRTTAPFLDTLYTYSQNGNLTSLRYPHGRTVTYSYPGSGADVDRVSSISITTHDGTGFNGSAVVASSVAWEPYGGLRGYVACHTGNCNVNSSRVEYMLGGDSSQAPTSTCDNTPPSTSSGYDMTARLRSLRVSNGPGSLGLGAGELFKRQYTWAGDQVARMETCYLNDGVPINEIASYDKSLRLTQVDAPNVSTAGGWQGKQAYTYNSRGNKTNIVVDGFGSNYSPTYSGLAHRPDLLLQEGSGGLAHDFSADVDGFTNAISTPNTSPTQVGSSFSFNRRAAGTYSSAVFNDTLTSKTFTYHYDAFNRRIKKTYPTDTSDYFLYDTGHQLLEDRGVASTVFPGTPFSIDEYVWLDGRPLAVVRAKMDGSLQRYADGTGTCSRNGQAVNCGTYTIVTDHIGKPVLTLDFNRRITGVGEYEPFGGLNRFEFWWGTGWSYTGTTGDSPAIAQQRAHGMMTAFRAHFTRFEAEQNGCGGGFVDGIQTSDNTTGATCGDYTGHLGENWTAWCPAVQNASGYSEYRLNWHDNGANCQPGCWFPSCPTGGGYAGFTMRDYEYQRYQADAGATMYFPPLRFPGQYFDEETHLHENWNRYYDPVWGGYTSIEPILASPAAPAWYALHGSSLPAYSYALNNPLNVYDDTGLGPTFGPVPYEPPQERSYPPYPDPFDPENAEEWADILGLNDGSGSGSGAGSGCESAAHTKNPQRKNWDKHTKKRPGAPEKGDNRRPQWPRQKPPNHKGPWPPKLPKIPIP